MAHYKNGNYKSTVLYGKICKIMDETPIDLRRNVFIDKIPLNKPTFIDELFNL